jgi:SAM-dependent methyltransferase
MRYIDQKLAEMEQDGGIGSRADAYLSLRELGLNDFGSVLWTMPDERFPRVSGLLPKMASEDTQRLWTGYMGDTLLSQSVSFMRATAANYADLTGSSLFGKRILDFGCGYGRLLRLAAFYSQDVFGVDPWDQSIRMCQEAGFADKIALSDWLPDTLPAPNDFDFVYAFSVFTHLSERAAKTCLQAIRKHTKAGGVLCLTVRPEEYWRMVYPTWPEEDLARKEREHRERGFTFAPQQRETVDGDITYGDTSMTPEWLATAAGPDWTIEGVDRALEDPVQRYVFLLAV